MIPYGKQSISEADIQAVIDVLRSDYLTQGPVVPQFEQSLIDACDAPYAVAVNSATSALHIACLALGAGPGDVVWTSPISFVASSNCALYCGADIDFVDIDPKTFNMSPEKLKEKLQIAKAEGRLPKIVIPVHLTGQSCEMEPIYNLSQEYGFSIIEDASHCIGASYQGQPIGNCRYSDIVVFSFHPVKIITTAEGGACMTRSAELADKMGLLRSHGITRDPARMTHASDGPWYYQQIDLGYNYRMTEMQAALGASQMTRLSEFIDRRQTLARQYDEKLKDLPLDTPYQHPDASSAYHLYVIEPHFEKLSKNHRQVFEDLRDAGIGVNLHYIPIHTQPYYQALGFQEGDFPNAEAYYARAISIPIYHAMSDAQQDEVVAVLRRVLV